MPLLTQELLDDIIFGMENQDNESVLDLQSGEVVSPDELDDEEEEADEDEGERYVDLPSWSSNDGFRLMEKFVTRIRNPYYQKRLSDILRGGHGVFRGFKDVLSEQPLLLENWYGFKRHEMEKVITKWYRDEQGSIALDELDGESPDEGLGDLLLEDFSLSFSDDASVGESLRKQLLDDIPGNVRPQIEMNLSLAHPQRYLYASGPDEAVCALLVFAVSDSTASVLFYGVESKWRGMGLFRLLFDTLARQLAREKVSTVSIGFAGQDMAVSSMFGNLPVMEISRTLAIPVSQYVGQSKNSEQAFM